METQEIVKMYVEDQLTLREIADKLNTNHKLIGRLLKKEGVKITKRNKLRVFSDEHRRKISESNKGRVGTWKGKKMPESTNRKNMVTKLGRLTVSIETLARYKDFNKLKFLTRGVSRHRKEFEGDEKFIAYLDKFYFCKEFNKQYDRWIESGKNKWYMPTIDHINPKASGGCCDLDNLRFITWFENRAKAEMPLDEWEEFKRKTNTKSDLFT